MLFKASFLFGVLSGASLVQAKIPVTGAKVPSSGVVPMRKNINVLQSTNGLQWDLYIQALNQMYKIPATDMTGFFQIAGIHGKPYVDYNGAGPQVAPSNQWLGYCPHGEDLFLPWHRPYVALYEQRLVEIATTIAKTYPTKYRARYLLAAETLRAPYWDWAATSEVPPATVPSTVNVRVPDGKGDIHSVAVSNPLQTYKFPQSALNGAFGSFDSQKRTQIYRCPSPNSYPSSANADLAKEPYKQWVYDAFTYSTTFKQFASTASSGISLEEIHNSIHWDGACGGQFLDANFAAFDPLFMLHHCNVDRLWTYWQFIRPDQVLFSGTYSGGSRWATPAGTTISANSPLQPFFTTSGGFHTPNSVASIKPFGYTYAGLEYWKKTPAQLQKDATAIINQLYSTGKVSASKRKRDDGEDDSGGEVTRYFVQVSVDVTQLARPCAIEFFVNTTSVGRFIVMQQPMTGTMNGAFSIDRATNPLEQQDNSNTTTVVDNVLSSLLVQITQADGTNIPVTTVPSLKMSLVNTTVIPPQSQYELPDYTDSDKHAAPKVQAPP